MEVSLLKPFHSDERYAPPPPIVEWVDGEKHYELEAIVGHRYSGKNKLSQYRVKWKGYYTLTWEPESVLREDAPETVDELIRVYTENTQQRKRAAPASKRRAKARKR